MKERDIKIILTQVRSLSTVVTNMDDPAYLKYPDHSDHLDHLDHLQDHLDHPDQRLDYEHLDNPAHVPDHLSFSHKSTARAQGPLQFMTKKTTIP